MICCIFSSSSKPATEMITSLTSLNVIVLIKGAKKLRNRLLLKKSLTAEEDIDEHKFFSAKKIFCHNLRILKMEKVQLTTP